MIKKEKGYIALSSLLIIAAVVVAIGFSMALIGIDQAKSSLAVVNGMVAEKIAEGCSEEALIRLRNDGSYTGGSLNFEEGSCTVSVTGSTPNFTLIITGIVNSTPIYSKKIQIVAKKRSNSITVISRNQVE